MAIERIGVIGAGQMGTGIAHVLALSGYDVVLDDINKDALAKAIGLIEKNMQRQAAKGLIKEDQIKPALARIRVTQTLDDLKDRELVIEAATEDEGIKNKIFQDLCTRISDKAMIATNTSSISVTRLASSTDRPESFIGLHFMNPVPVMQLIEVIRGLATDQATYDAVADAARRMGKTPVEVHDAPGFVSNRVLMPMINEAIFAVYEGVAKPEAIDEVMKLGMNHPMAPLTLADFIGLDVCLAILNVLHDGLGDPKYRPCPLLRRMVDAGWLGRKSGRGFYRY